MNPINILKQSAFSGNWIKADVASFSQALKQFVPELTVLRAWQEECANALITADKPNRLIVAPTGSGKSIAINYLISHMLHNKMASKLIVSVPQKAIGGGFTSKPMLFPMDTEGKETFEFSVKYDYCADNDDSKTDAVIEFLENSVTITPSDRILVCVNNTLVNVYSKLKARNKLHLLNDVALWLDEAHHVQTETDDVANRLGALVLHCLQNNISVNAVTATAFRGDRLSIIPKEYADTFARFTLPYDRHFAEHCDGMAFTYDFVLHKEDWYDGFRQILTDYGDDDRKTIVFVPHPNTRAFKASSECKDECVRDILAIIKGDIVLDSEYIEDSDGVLTVTRGKRKIRIVDLVSNFNRPNKVEYLRGSEGSTVDYVIGINVPKEGFDWTCANREFIIGPKSSLNELMQMMGRTFRGHSNKGADKEPVQIFHLLPWIDDSKVEKAELRNALNDYLKAVYISMIGESIMNPPSDIKIPVRKQEGEAIATPNEALEYVITALGGWSNWVTFREDCIDECRNVRTDNEGISKKEMNALIRDTIAKVIIAEESIEKYQEEIEALIFRSFMSRSFDLYKQVQNVNGGLDVSAVDFDILEEVDSMYFVLWYSNGFCNATTFKELREAIGEYASLEDHIKWIADGQYTQGTWRSEGYSKYKIHGATHSPDIKFGVSWYTLRGKPIPEASLEQHKLWIREGNYSKASWKTDGYKKYKEFGAAYQPDVKFGVSWYELRGETPPNASLEQHKLWIREGNYNKTSWNSRGYKKYKNSGAIYAPDVKFKIKWSELKK